MVRHDGSDRLLAYLRTHVEDDVHLSHHMVLMEPFFEHALDQRYRLYPIGRK